MMTDTSTERSTSGVTGFRGDIQGMRAVAVLAVIAGHAGVPFLPGGFVGVDVFFVISGFLITQLILNGISRDGGFSIGRFYARRARRILPAASVVLAVTVAASVVYLNFLDAMRATEDAVWAAFFAANVRFGQQGVDYFASDQSPSPLQHYWSLAVEEQFYLVWPLLIALVVVVYRVISVKSAPGWVPTRALAVGALLVGGASLYYCIRLTQEEPAAAYFSSPGRAWELAAGALVAIVLRHGRAPTSRWVTDPLALVGLGAIGYAVVAFDESMAFPGVAALAPVLGTVAVLVAGAHRSRPSWTSRALAIGPLRSVGDWSYSLYLWHWPLLIIPQVRLGRDLTLTETLIAIAVTFQLAYLTYRFVEQPFRTGTFWRPSMRGLLLYPLSLLLVLPAIYGSHARAVDLSAETGDNPAITPRSVGIDSNTVESQVRASVVAAQDKLPIPSDLTPDLVNLSDEVADVGTCDYTRGGWHLCRHGDVTSDKVMVITGDSHARVWIPAFEKIAKEAGYAAYYLVKPQCSAAYVDVGAARTGELWPECADFHTWVTEQLKTLQPDLMIVSTSPPINGIYVDGKHVTDADDMAKPLAAGYDDMFATYEPLVDRLVLLMDVPRIGLDPTACLTERNVLFSDCISTPSDTSRMLRDVSVASAVSNNVETVDPTHWVCSEDLCPLVVGSTIAFRDASHLTTTRSGQLWQPLGQKLGLLPTPSTPPSTPATPQGEPTGDAVSPPR